MSSTPKRVLVVEDETEIRELIALHLRREGYLVDDLGTGDLARTQLSKQPYDMVIVDWMLPGLSGLELTRWIRTELKQLQLPILFVTAKTDPEHVAAGLDAGADDYLAKPFDTLVLMARVNALMRRKSWMDSFNVESEQSPHAHILIGELKLDRDAYEVYLRDEKLDLTKSEFKLLEALMMSQGKVLTRKTLIELIQGDGVNVVGRTVDTHVFGLRKKLKDHSELIETIRGVGYRVKLLNG
ncbi:MAG TPA: DNA-binding response regulator [Bdellovibrionales bacterium]|nr:DNA-binding response regulator [Pseudobdellovibrionaceae bacterium]HAG91454.1 DNA-binding response regulator [Bdellovibrionales bacterium]|tara:strand:- start:233 stop:955 length:723 start_codon:yes stop_codon:yes gene_type:complete